MKINGTCQNHLLVLRGSGNVDASNMEAQMAEVKSVGSGNVDVSANQSLSVSLAGSGNVVYHGEPAELRKSITGSGLVKSN